MMPTRARPPRMLRDWGNRIARPVDEYTDANPNHAYSAQQFDELRGFDLYLFSGRALFTDTGAAQAAEVADGAPILAYVNVLHTFLPDYYEASPWPFPVAQGELFSGSHLLNDAGEPSIRWKASDPRWNSYHQDPEKVDPEENARLYLDWAQRHGAAGLFLDYLAQAPWTYPDEPGLTLPDGGLLWQAFQVRLVYHLRRLAPPGFLLIANGRWAMEEPGWQRIGWLDGVFWEALGTLWWTPDQVLRHLQELAAEGLDLTWHLYEGHKPRNPRHGNWDVPTLAAALAITPGGFQDLKYNRGDNPVG